MTTERTRKALLALSLTILFVAEAKGRAADVVLDRNDIQTLRFLEQRDHPDVLKSLSRVGWKTLFGERGLAINSASVASSGWWRWRWPHDITLNRGEQGKSTDAALLTALLNRTAGPVPGTAGPVPGTEIVIDKWVLDALQWNRDYTTGWYARGGGNKMENPYYKMLVDHGINLWESLDYPRDRKDRLSRSSKVF